jgi:cystathionine beta-lyase/cystathionine gamma-synthase
MVSPIHVASVYRFTDLDALERVLDGVDAGFYYARDGHPNRQQLADAVTRWHGGAWSIICGSGMAALCAALVPALRAGERVVAGDFIYGRTRKLLTHELARWGVTTQFVDTGDLDAVRQALQVPTRVLLAETISNPHLRVADLPALAELAQAHGAKLVVDNTFATPLLARPLAVGAQRVVESLTKLLAGHSDLTLGSVTGRVDDELAETQSACSTWGWAAGAFDCWLAERGLLTASLRFAAAQANAAALADWLPTQPSVQSVIYPTRADHPDAALTRRLYGTGGNMLSFTLANRDAVNAFLRHGGIPFVPSLGHVTTTCSHPATASHRYDTPAERARLGITDGLVRVSVGIEPWPELQAAFAAGLRA